MRGALLGAWAAAVLAISAVPLSVGYSAWWALPVLLGCVLVPTATVGLGRWARLGAGWIGIGAGVLGVVAALSVADQGVAGDPVWWRQSPGLEFLGPLIDAVPRLLTAPRPAPAQLGYLVPAALLVWLVALGVALAVSARGRQRVAPLVGAVVLHTAGALLTTGQGDPYGVQAALTVAVLLLGWVSIPARRSARAPAPTTGGWLIGASAAVLVAALALSATALGGGRAFEPRTLVPPPQLPAEAANPLPNVSLWNSRADDVLFTLRPVSGPAPTQVRLAVLPDFDGAAWTLDARLRQVGVVEEPDLPAGTWRQEVSYELTLADGTGAWLPSLGRTTAVSGADVLMDVDTGVLVTPGGRPPAGPVEVSASVAAPSDQAVTRAGVPPRDQAARYLALPRLPAELTAAAEQVTSGEPTRWGQVTALADYVRAERTLDKGAPSGSSYGRIAEFLYAEEADGGQVGTTEQFAAALAVLARAAGIPSRLVVGFDLADAERSDGALVVTGDQARVWTEVYFARAGWLPVDPSPDSSVMTEHTPPEEGGGDGTEDVQPPDVEPTQAPAEAPAASSPAGTEEAAAWPVWLLGGAGGGLVLALLGLVTARAVRRSRWRRGGAMGAWALLLDALVLAGRPARADATPDGIAAALAADPGVVVQPLADQAQAEAFAPPTRPTPPTPAVGGSAGGRRYSGTASDRHSDLSPAGAAAEGDAWASAVAAERALRASSPRWRRLVWFCSPVVLRRRQPVHWGAEEPLAASSPSVPG